MLEACIKVAIRLLSAISQLFANMLFIWHQLNSLQHDKLGVYNPQPLIISFPRVTGDSKEIYFTPTYSESNPAYTRLHPSSLFNDKGKERESDSFSAHSCCSASCCKIKINPPYQLRLTF